MALQSFSHNRCRPLHPVIVCLVINLLVGHLLFIPRVCLAAFQIYILTVVSPLACRSFRSSTAATVCIKPVVPLVVFAALGVLNRAGNSAKHIGFIFLSEMSAPRRRRWRRSDYALLHFLRRALCPIFIMNVFAALC